MLNGLTIAIAFPLKVFLNDLATLLLLDAEDFVDFESESESESAGLLFDLVGSRIGNDGLSTSSTSSSSFCCSSCLCEGGSADADSFNADSADADGKVDASNVDALLSVSTPLGWVSLNEGFEESRLVGGLLELEGDFGKPDFDFNFVVLLLGDGLLLLLDFGGGLLAVGNLFGGGLCFFFGLSELTLLLFRGCNLPAKK